VASRVFVGVATVSALYSEGTRIRAPPKPACPSRSAFAISSLPWTCSPPRLPRRHRARGRCPCRPLPWS
jgi:hypothetical protein